MPSSATPGLATVVAASATGAVVAVAVGELLRRLHSRSSSHVDSVDELRANMQQLSEVVMQLARTGREGGSPRSTRKSMYEMRNSSRELHAAGTGTGWRAAHLDSPTHSRPRRLFPHAGRA